MRSQSYLPIHSYRQPRKEAVLKPTYPYTITNNPGKMRSQSYLPIQLPTTPERCGLNPTCPYIYQQPRKDVASNLPHTLISTNPERRGLKPNWPYTLTDNPGKMRSQTYLPRHLAYTFFMPLNSYLKTTSPDTLISLTDKPRKIPLYTGLRHTCPYTLQTNLERCRSTNTGFIPK